MKIFIPLISIWMCLYSFGELHAESRIASSQSAIREYFRDPPYRPSIWRTDSVRNVEICEDLCMLVQWKDSDAQEVKTASWDALFLFRYFHYGYPDGFDDDFVKRYSGVATRLLREHDGLCSPNVKIQEKARCVLDEIVTKNELLLSSVRYDEGYRCVTPISTRDLKASSKDKCYRLKGSGRVREAVVK